MPPRMHSCVCVHVCVWVYVVYLRLNSGPYMLDNHFAIELYPEQECSLCVFTCMPLCVLRCVYLHVCMPEPKIDFFTYFWDRATH